MAGENQLVRLLLMPGEATLAAEDPEPDAIHLAGRDLACPEHAARATVIAQEDMDIVVQPPALAEGGKLGRDRLRLQARDVVDDVIGMRPDIAEAAAPARLRRVRPPYGLLQAGLLDRLRQPGLRIFRHG